MPPFKFPFWRKTEVMKERLEDKIQYIKGIPYYEGRHIICRDSPINGGVCVGQGKREAIVVDSKKYPEIKKIYKKALELTKKYNGWVLPAVYETVQNALKYNESAVEKLIKEKDVENDGKICLDVFIKRGVAVCRQQALTCGVLLELFKNDGYLKGKISIDRNVDYGGHTWCRYTCSNGIVYILDVAQGFFGTLEESVRRRTWNYKRPGE